MNLAADERCYQSTAGSSREEKACRGSRVRPLAYLWELLIISTVGYWIGRGLNRGKEKQANPAGEGNLSGRK